MLFFGSSDSIPRGNFYAFFISMIIFNYYFHSIHLLTVFLLMVGPSFMMGMEETSKRRSFFSSPDDLFDDDYYDDQPPEKKRRLTQEQVFE